MVDYHLSGTSGFSYDNWMSTSEVGNFYPHKTKKTQQLDYYSSRFNFVEINSTFYKHPSVKTLTNWYRKTPDDFRFLVKANKYITHSKKLLDFEETFSHAFDLYFNLQEKCIGIILQMPGTFVNNKINRKRVLDAGRFTTSMDNPYQYQIFIEFRHESWFQTDIYELLRDIKWSLVVVNLGGKDYDVYMTWSGFTNMRKGFSPRLSDIISEDVVTPSGEVIAQSAVTVPDCIMFRCHGTSMEVPYCGVYDEEDIMTMASISLSKKKSIIAFDNTDSRMVMVDDMGITVTPCATFDANRTMALL